MFTTVLISFCTDGACGPSFALACRTISPRPRTKKKMTTELLHAALVHILNLTNQTKMTMTNDVVDIAIGSDDHTTLVAAVKAADLVGALKGDGPFTVFAPSNMAFGKLPAGTVEELVKPESKGALTSVLTYHVVSGNLDAAAVIAAITAGGGKAVLTTLNGAKLTGSMEGGSVVLTDNKGGKSTVTAADLKGSNGVVHVIDSVLMP